MNKWFRIGLILNRFKLLILFVGVFVLITVGVVTANSVRNSKLSETSSVIQDITKADFEDQQNFSLAIEQDDDTPLKILSAQSKTISASQYKSLTSEATNLQEVVSVPEIVVQNVSEKTIVGITLIINDKGLNTQRGLYIREQSIAPGEKFTIYPENFVKTKENPAQSPKFWLSSKDKSQVVVGVSPIFKDGTQWFNKSWQ